MAVLSALFVLIAAGVAMASSVSTAVVDTTAPLGEVSLEAGQSAAIQINLTVTGNQDGTATFQVNRDWSLSGGSFTGSNPQTFTVPPRSASTPALNLSTTGTISVAAGQTVGNFPLAIGAFNVTNSNSTGGKLSAGTLSNYLVHVVPPADSTPPVITPSVSGTVGDNDWYVSDVTVAFVVTDPQSAVTSKSVGCTLTTITADTTGTTLTCTATSAGGTASKSVTVKRDTTAPSITATPSAAANAAGFTNTPVDVSYACSDDTSGLAGTCPATDHATVDGSYTFTHAIHDKAGNTSSVSTTVTLDATKPSISGSASPAANGAGWNNGPVTVTFTCLDGGSGIKSCVADGSADDHRTLSADGAGQSVSGTATDNADNTNTATVGGISIDTVAPAIAFASRTPANAAGWNSSDVVVTWTCTDGGSGAADSTVTQTLSGNGAGQSATGTCTDLAGNSASATVGGINIDKSAPVISFDNRAPAANGAGWNSSDVTVTWNCSDAVSDVVHAAVSEAVSGEGASQSVTGTCTDLAGNTASDTQGGISIDKTAPSIAFDHQSPSANAAGWNRGDVTLVWNCADALSGPVSATASKTVTGEGTDLGATGTCTDLAGNASSAEQRGVKIDRTAPAVTVTGVANGASYVLGSVPAAGCATSDGLSGVQTSVALSLSGGPVGSVTATCSGAKDNADNAGASVSATYSVTYSWSGFFQPIDNSASATVFNVAKAGQSVPAKFSLGGNQGLNIIAAGYPKVTTVTCASGAATDTVEEYATTTNQGLVYDATANQYNYVWKTQSSYANSCRAFDLMLVDGTHHVAYFKFTK